MTPRLRPTWKPSATWNRCAQQDEAGMTATMKLCGLAAAVALLLCGAAAKAQPAGIPGPTYTDPLGIALEGWPYPYPVHFMPLEIGGQKLRMAYMDVAPTGTPN